MFAVSALPPQIASSRLWLVTDREFCAPLSIAEMLRKAIPAGIDLVVFRMKDADEKEFLRAAKESLLVCREFHVPMVISHRIDTAIKLGADGVHLGTGDPSLTEVRPVLPARMSIGYSTHSVEEARDCLRKGYDYVFLGPVFESPRKLRYGLPLGPEVVSQTAELSDRIVYIGGLDQHNIKLLLKAGATRFAAIRAFQQSPDFTGRISTVRDSLEFTV